jgi:NAD(P)-dependent dehydrogenase (short-subunit alcohol dehydrogenase family)
VTAIPKDEEVLETAIARVAQAIASMPADDKARALEAAERSYCETAVGLGYTDGEADRGRGEQVVASINAGGGAAEFLQADFSALAEVRRLADAVQRTTRRLNLLINNAGIGSGGPHGTRQTSVDGHESRFAVNYLAGFLLTDLLLPLLKKSAPARVVNVSSLGQQALDFTDVMLTREYSGIRAYRQSKLAQILFTIDLAQELEGSGTGEPSTGYASLLRRRLHSATETRHRTAPALASETLR